MSVVFVRYIHTTINHALHTTRSSGARHELFRRRLKIILCTNIQSIVRRRRRRPSLSLSQPPTHLPSYFSFFTSFILWKAHLICTQTHLSEHTLARFSCSASKWILLLLCMVGWMGMWSSSVCVRFSCHIQDTRTACTENLIRNTRHSTARHGMALAWLWHGSGMAYNNNTDAARALNIEQHFIFFWCVLCVMLNSPQHANFCTTHSDARRPLQQVECLTIEKERRKKRCNAVTTMERAMTRWRYCSTMMATTDFVATRKTTSYALCVCGLNRDARARVLHNKRK